MAGRKYLTGKNWFISDHLLFIINISYVRHKFLYMYNLPYQKIRNRILPAKSHRLQKVLTAKISF